MDENVKQEEITVYMLPGDAKLFLEFQRHYEVFSVLSAKRVFEQRGAAITLHFDPQGLLKAVTRADVLFSDKADFTNTN